MPHRAALFLAPTFLVLVGFGLLLGLTNLLFPATQPTELPPAIDNPGLLGAGDATGDKLKQVVLPSPEIPPEEVVRLQLAGLSDTRADGLGILQCYSFASPSNRSVTGPLERFGQMVRQGPYRCMARPRALLVGRPQYRDDAARLLVTVVDDDATVHAFTFFLARQQSPPFLGCWMTEAVLPSLPPAATEPPAAAPAA